MCRIAGIIDKKSDTVAIDILAMRDSMSHGGPDSSGVYHDESKKMSLGHRRLSIIDLTDAGHQPMFSPDGSIVIVYNGEIYNYRELKRELQNKGVVFFTNSDTEVIIQAYKLWGVACFEKLKGMFAIALHDKNKNELVLVRDPNGIKPLYYYADDSSLYFASEIRAFKVTTRTWEESDDWKLYFLTFGFLPEPVTTLRGVKPLAKGTYLRIETDTLKIKQEVFDADTYSDIIDTEEKAIHTIREKLNASVDRHLISDAPIGMFLSGGIDSSLLTLIAKATGHNDLHTLSIVFDDKDFSEEEYQNIIARKVESKHKPFKLTKELFVEAIPDIFKAMDQPSADGVNTYFICKFAKAYGLKAVLSGLGADELFGGYASFVRTGVVGKLNAMPKGLLQLTSKLHKDKYRKISFLTRKDAVGEYLFNRGFFSVAETSEIIGANSKEVTDKLMQIVVPDFVEQLHAGNRVSYMERNLYMQSQLLKDTDAMSMWHSIEVRVPFLDIDLVHAVNAISPGLKFDGVKPKHLLIESYKDILPEKIWNRQKQGFVFPFQKWMQGNETKVLQSVDAGMTSRYHKGAINWSRYWTYAVANMYSALN